MRTIVVAVLMSLGWVGGLCGVTTFSFEQDDRDGVALRVTGTGLPAGGWQLDSPSGIWSFPFTRLYAAFDQPEPWMLTMYFDVILRHRDDLRAEPGMQNHAFNEQFGFIDPENPVRMDTSNPEPGLIVRENTFAFGPDIFYEPVIWEAENFLRVDARPRLMEPASWEWTFFTSFRNPAAVPDAGSTLGLLSLALCSLGALAKRI